MKALIFLIFILIFMIILVATVATANQGVPATLLLELNPENSDELEIHLKIISPEPIAGYEAFLYASGLELQRTEEGDFFPSKIPTLFATYDGPPNVKRGEIGILHVILGLTPGFKGAGIVSKLFFEKRTDVTFKILRSQAVGPGLDVPIIKVDLGPDLIIGQGERPVTAVSKRDKLPTTWGTIKRRH